MRNLIFALLFLPLFWFIGPTNAGGLTAHAAQPSSSPTLAGCPSPVPTTVTMWGFRCSEAQPGAEPFHQDGLVKVWASQGPANLAPCWERYPLLDSLNFATTPQTNCSLALPYRDP